MKSLTVPKQYRDLPREARKDHFQTSYVEEYPDSEHLIALDDRFSSGERFQREEQIRREVEHALAVQKLCRARKAKMSALRVREPLANVSTEPTLGTRNSLISRACTRQDTAYSPVVAGDLSRNGASHPAVSRSHAGNCPTSRGLVSLTEPLLSSPKKSAFFSRFNLFKTSGRVRQHPLTTRTQVLAPMKKTAARILSLGARDFSI